MTSLVRTMSSGVDISDAFGLDQIKYQINNGGIKKIITPIDELLKEIKLIIVLVRYFLQKEWEKKELWLKLELDNMVWQPQRFVRYLI